MTFREILIAFVIFDFGFLAGYFLKVFLLNRWLTKNGIKPKEFWKE